MQGHKKRSGASAAAKVVLENLEKTGAIRVLRRDMAEQMIEMVLRQTIAESVKEAMRAVKAVKDGA
jgi:hypothetical protein